MRNQNLQNRREVIADEKLKRVVGGPKVTMFELSKHLAHHIGSTHRSGGGRDD
jgi:chromatin remodeling complex protein RSC6